MQKSKELKKIDDAFSKLQKQENRFLECERIYNAQYEDAGRIYRTRPEDLSRSKLYVPLVKTTINIIHSIFKTSFLATECPIEISRVGQNTDNDMILAAALTAAVKKKWREGDHYTGISSAVLSALYLPLGIAQVFWDRDIKTKFIPINDVAFDTHATSINDIEYLCYKFKQSKKEAEKKLDDGFYKLPPENTKEQVITALSSDRVEIKELYERKYKNGSFYWQLTSFANDIFVREAKFSKLPFCFGYCFESTPPIDRDKREKDYIAVYGVSLAEQLKELQEEYNIKRNQKIDITEMIIDPQFAIDSTAGAVSMTDLTNRSKYVKVQTNNGARVSDMIIPISTPGTYDLKDEIGILQAEYEVASGVNSIMTGQTSASDRRGVAALQTVNAASGTRVEAMVQTLTKTLLNSFAKKFVNLIYRNMPTDEFVAITENPLLYDLLPDPLDRKQTDLSIDIAVNFGTTLQNDMQINKLNTLLGVLAQNNLGTPVLVAPILKEIMILMLGENAPINKIDEALQEIAAAQQAQQQTQAILAESEMKQAQAAASEADLRAAEADAAAAEQEVSAQTSDAIAQELAAQNIAAATPPQEPAKPIMPEPAPSATTGKYRNLGDIIFAD